MSANFGHSVANDRQKHAKRCTRKQIEYWIPTAPVSDERFASIASSFGQGRLFAADEKVSNPFHNSRQETGAGPRGPILWRFGPCREECRAGRHGWDWEVFPATERSTDGQEKAEPC